MRKSRAAHVKCDCGEKFAAHKEQQKHGIKPPPPLSMGCGGGGGGGGIGAGAGPGVDAKGPRAIGAACGGAIAGGAIGGAVVLGVGVPVTVGGGVGVGGVVVGVGVGGGGGGVEGERLHGTVWALLYAVQLPCRVNKNEGPKTGRCHCSSKR